MTEIAMAAPARLCPPRTHMEPESFIESHCSGMEAASNPITKIELIREILEPERGCLDAGGNDLNASWLELYKERLQ